MKAWKIKGRFPTADEMSRMVAAEVRTRVEAALERATRGIGRIPMCLRRLLCTIGIRQGSSSFWGRWWGMRPAALNTEVSEARRHGGFGDEGLSFFWERKCNLEWSIVNLILKMVSNWQLFPIPWRIYKLIWQKYTDFGIILPWLITIGFLKKQLAIMVW